MKKNLRIGYENINAWNSQYDYYFTLPDEIQAAVNEHEDEIRTIDDLHSFVENLILRS